MSRDDLILADVVTLQSVNTHTTYSWSIAYKPEGSTATLSGSPVAQNPGTFTVDKEGPYLLRLIADLSLPTESQQFVRLRYLTVLGQLRLVSAGEQTYSPVPVPVDIGVTGWADQQNFNLLTLLGLISSVSSSGNIYTVDLTPGYGDFQTIQAAIDAAVLAGASVSSPWIVKVHPGLYTESVVFKAHVHVMGDSTGQRNTVVRGFHTTSLANAGI
jgi:hypothetical protein